MISRICGYGQSSRNDSDEDGARVGQFFVRLHKPNSSSHRALLQSILLQVDATLQSETAARNGLILIYDMSNAKFGNLDYEFTKKLFTTLKSKYPIRLRYLVILTSSLWTKTSCKILRAFVQDYLKECVHIIEPKVGSELASLANPGHQPKSHRNWIQVALKRLGIVTSEKDFDAYFFDRPFESSTVPRRMAVSSDGLYLNQLEAEESGSSQSSFPESPANHARVFVNQVCLPLKSAEKCIIADFCHFRGRKRAVALALDR
ncbi:hypothetical protein Ciccas_004721 [Cichlidogyrus casuarinus]|uniref:CRAL-TRIO domain-containing protein n=1 Tax=Cichlidogyrus casuarinus TaxID=1844966 RepID=A0ABD2QAP9_9PLAT